MDGLYLCFSCGLDLRVWCGFGFGFGVGLFGYFGVGWVGCCLYVVLLVLFVWVFWFVVWLFVGLFSFVCVFVVGMFVMGGFVLLLDVIGWGGFVGCLGGFVWVCGFV